MGLNVSDGQNWQLQTDCLIQFQHNFFKKSDMQECKILLVHTIHKFNKDIFKCCGVKNSEEENLQQQKNENYIKIASLNTMEQIKKTRDGGVCTV